jgi:hypothetical protein
VILLVEGVAQSGNGGDDVKNFTLAVNWLSGQVRITIQGPAEPA